MKLNETVELMNSEDYKKRFKAEYFQLKIRIDGLVNMLEKYREGKLLFEPKCSYLLLSNQLHSMDIYLDYLERRAEIENIDLEEEY